VYIGNISPEVEHEELRAIIASYGPLVSMRMYRKEGYGFAEFENHHDAVRAILGAYSRLSQLYMRCECTRGLWRPGQYCACTTDMPAARQQPLARLACSARPPHCT